MEFLASYGVRFSACSPECVAEAAKRINEVIEEALEMEFDDNATLVGFVPVSRVS